MTLVGCRVAGKGIAGRIPLSGRVTPRFLIEFYHRLSQALALGLPVLTVLDENARTLPSRRLRKVAGEIRLAIENGSTLHEAMGRYPGIFDRVDLGVIKMGEISGVLPKCIRELADFLEWKEDLKSTLRRAALYPAFVILVIGAVIGVWIGYVLPRMARVLVEMGVELPGVTRAILDVSLFFRTSWPAMVLGGVILAAAFCLFLKTERGGVLFHRCLLKAPLVGGIAENIVFARLSHHFATMYRAGLTLISIFEILKDHVLGNRYLEERLGIAFDYIQSGQQIAEGFRNAGGFPPLLIGAVSNGELTGTLDESFRRLGEYYDREVKQTVQALINAVEPGARVFIE